MLRVFEAWRAGIGRCGVIAAIAVFGLLSALATERASAQEYQYRLGGGDQVKITVFGHEDLSGVFQVGSNGTVSLPLIGEVRSLNLTLPELEKAITQKLKPDYLKNPQVNVEVINYRPFYIIGEVKNPGSYAYVGGMKVVNAVAMAGGFTYRAEEDEIYITRAEGSGKRELANQASQVLPGDVIEVPERFF